MTLDDLAALEKASTPAPWKHDLGNCEIEGPRPLRHPICDVSLDARGLNTADANPVNPYDDAEFIAAIRNAAPILIEVARAATHWLDEHDCFYDSMEANAAREAVREAIARLEGVGK